MASNQDKDLENKVTNKEVENEEIVTTSDQKKATSKKKASTKAKTTKTKKVVDSQKTNSTKKTTKKSAPKATATRKKASVKDNTTDDTKALEESTEDNNLKQLTKTVVVSKDGAPLDEVVSEVVDELFDKLKKVHTDSATKEPQEEVQEDSDEQDESFNTRESVDFIAPFLDGEFEDSEQEKAYHAEKIRNLGKHYDTPEAKSVKNKPKKIYVLPVNGKPFLPHQIKGVQVVDAWADSFEEEMENSHNFLIAIMAVPEGKANKPLDPEDFDNLACLVKVNLIPGFSGQFIAHGICRVKIKNPIVEDGKIIGQAEYPKLETPEKNSDEEREARAIYANITDMIRNLVPLDKNYLEQLKQVLMNVDIENPSVLADCAAGITSRNGKELQAILNETNLLARLKLVNHALFEELHIARIHNKMSERVSTKISEKQYEYFLREELREICKELNISPNSFTNLPFADGEKDPEAENPYLKKLLANKPNEEVLEKAKENISRLATVDPSSTEYGVLRDYVECLVNVPWGVSATESTTLAEAENVLNEEHEALKDVKERIVEHIALSLYNKEKDYHGSILLFVGPPGVGKTSIGHSIAKALKRPFYRISLGGVNDEAEIRGHRRTYIGAYAGKFVQALVSSKVNNPVIMLDEIDKVASSNRGDPASALLEALDPEQNNTFVDHYLDLKLDLSKCVFICTANTVDTIPPALLDRMEMISLPGYLADEKFNIAKKYLIPKILKKAGVDAKSIKIADNVIRKLIDEYAREAGVRNLERSIEKIVRKSVVKLMKLSGLDKVDTAKDASEIADETNKNSNKESTTKAKAKSAVVKVQEKDLLDLLGVAPFARERKLSGVGIITGLAWTERGGVSLPVEAQIIARNKTGGVKITGNLGQVMKESAELAVSYVRAHLKDLAPTVFAKDPQILDESVIHIHAPEGAIPKDGPSAGITLSSAILSTVLNKAPKEGVAMTGEVTLTGAVLAIGGLREKIIGAKRIGVYELIVPLANKCDVDNMPDYVKEGVTFHFVDNYEEVAKILF